MYTVCVGGCGSVSEVDGESECRVSGREAGEAGQESGREAGVRESRGADAHGLLPGRRRGAGSGQVLHRQVPPAQAVPLLRRARVPPSRRPAPFPSGGRSGKPQS